MAQGGKRINAGRKKGSKTSNNNTTFYARCTEEEKTLLKDFLKKIRKGCGLCE